MASKVGITQVSGKATLNYVEAEAIVSFARARGITSSRLINILTTKTNLTATDIFLIARVLDQSFTDTPTVTESDAKSIAKVFSDSITISEEALLNQALASIADSTSVSESFSVAIACVGRRIQQYLVCVSGLSKARGAGDLEPGCR